MADINISEINSLARDNPAMLISESEERYHAKISELAGRVCASKSIRLVLLAGPSGSGKTTTANLLCDEIKSHGEGCMVVSLDDFYRSFDDVDYPRLASGALDCESPEALDIPLLTKTLGDIAENREFLLPKYDFKLSKRSSVRKYPRLDNGCVIIEGLHALSPLVFSAVPEERALKIFISVSTNIISDTGERIISGRKIRFMRRMVRDSLYRNADSVKTLSMWKNVLIGEDKYLYPNRKYADVSFDTFHMFELSVMRPFVERLISGEPCESDEYARTVLFGARAAFPIPHSLVPEDSLIREFIPGGIYEALY